MFIDEVNELSNSQFESLIAEIAKGLGYSTEIIPLGQDIGIDIIAKKKNESLAIQVKKYKTRNLLL